MAALIRMNGSLSINNQQFVLNVQTENAAIARRIYSLLKIITTCAANCWSVVNEIKKEQRLHRSFEARYTARAFDLDIMDGLMFQSHVSDEIMGNTQKCVPIYEALSWHLGPSTIQKPAAII